MSGLPALQTMLPLLEQLLCTALQSAGRENRLRLERVRLTPRMVVLQLGLRGVAAPLDGSYLLELHLLESTPVRTVCEPKWAQAGGLGKLVGLGARLAPRALLNEALQRLLGSWLRVEGEQIVIDHAGLIAALAKRGGAAPG